MLRWVQALAATGLWAFVLAGVVGLVEAVSQWLRFGAPAADPDAGFLATVAPHFTLYGWAGLTAAVLVFLPAAVLLRGRPHPRRNVFALCIGAAMAFVGVVYVGYLIKDSGFVAWWQGAVGGLWPLKLVLWIALTAALGAPCRSFASYLVGNPRRNLFIPVAVIVVATALWPDWRAEAARLHTGDLVRIVADDETPSGPDVLLITVDTLRRDKLSCLDADAPPTPALDALAAEGDLYRNAWGVSSWTLPNMAAIFTGFPPRALGLEQYVGLPEAVPTLAEAAWRAGWHTAAVAANPYLGYEYGFQRGFQEYDHALVLEPLAPAARSVLVRELTRYVINATGPNDAEVLIRKALLWLERYDDPRPYLLWIHMMDPHLPYRWHDLDDGRTADLPDHPLLAEDRFEGLQELRAMLPDVPDDLREAVERLYDREVRYADGWLGRLFAALKESGRWDRTMVVVVADHGEEFFEHGAFEHGHSLMPEVTGVPLIVRRPDRGGGVSDLPVTLLDLAPSLCRELGWPETPDVPGRTVLTAAPDVPASPSLVFENMLYGDDQQAWWRWPDFRADHPDGSGAGWYDLADDPVAASPQAGPPSDLPALAESVRALLDAWDDLAVALDAHGREEAELSETSRRQLESLGY